MNKFRMKAAHILSPACHFHQLVWLALGGFETTDTRKDIMHYKRICLSITQYLFSLFQTDIVNDNSMQSCCVFDVPLYELSGVYRVNSKGVALNKHCHSGAVCSVK